MPATQKPQQSSDAACSQWATREFLTVCSSNYQASDAEQKDSGHTANALCYALKASFEVAEQQLQIPPDHSGHQHEDAMASAASARLCHYARQPSAQLLLPAVTYMTA